MNLLLVDLTTYRALHSQSHRLPRASYLLGNWRRKRPRDVLLLPQLIQSRPGNTRCFHSSLYRPGKVGVCTTGGDVCPVNCPIQLIGVLLAWVATISGTFILLGSVTNFIVAEKTRGIADCRLTFFQ